MSNIKVEMLSINDFNQICRTCSSDGELKPLFDNIETLSMLESFTQMQFSKMDELPQNICTNCLTKINECFHFINNCKIVDEGLRRCLANNLKQLEMKTCTEIKTDELHSSIDIKQEDEEAEPPETIQPQKQDLIDEQPVSETREKIKEINVKQSEYYILKWGTPAENQENKNFQFTIVNNPSNEQDLIEQDALRRHQLVNRMRKYRTRHQHSTSEEAFIAENKRKINSITQTTEIFDETTLRRANTIDEAHRRVNTIDETHRRTITIDETHRRAPTLEETHRARAKLTLPHEEHNVVMRRTYDTPERIALRRALAREQMRKYRSKLTADETAEHRAQVAENMRKFRAKLHSDDVDVLRAQTRIFRGEMAEASAQAQQIPLRLSEMAQTLLKPRDPLETTPRNENPLEMSRFSLRPTKIPQVKKQCYETRSPDNQQLKFRSWKRQIESPDEITIRLAKNSLQMKRVYPSMKETGGLVEESALRRAKAAGQLRQYRPVLRKNKTIPVPHSQTGK